MHHDIVWGMTRRTVALCGLVVLCVLLATATAGCFGGLGGGGGTTSSKGTIVGYVSEIDMSDEMRIEATFLASSPGVAGASATLVGTSKLAQTSSVGKFSITSVTPGTYDLLLQKTGRPCTIVYGVKVEANRTSEVSLRMVKPGSQVTSRLQETTPPTVTVDCPSMVSGTVQVTVTPSDESGIFGVLLFLDEDSEPECSWGFGSQVVESGQPLVWEWNTVSGSPNETGWNNGEHKLVAMVVDSNYNIAYRIVTATVENEAVQGTLPVAPSDLRCTVTTMHYSLFTFPWSPGDIGSASSDELARVLAPAGTAKAFREGSGPKARGTPSGSDAVILASAYWRYETADAMGFKVYRNGRFVADVLRGEWEEWMDGSPVLTPGQRVEYAVSAYNRAGEGPKSAPVSRTPIAPLRGVSLTSPADETVIAADVKQVGATPVFDWEPVSGAEAYAVFVAAITDDPFWTRELVWVGLVRGGATTSITYGDNSLIGQPPSPPLEPGEYVWGVMALSLEPNLPASGTLNLEGYEPQVLSVSASEVWGFTVSTD